MWHTCEDKYEARESLGAWLLTALVLSTVKALTIGDARTLVVFCQRWLVALRKGRERFGFFSALISPEGSVHDPLLRSA